ncbi:hypothetical protein CBR_g17008 [Chara braunii]|uniref:Uncharacterized protein n=1 Tax=Chara braunii TaxID=69332 RepID=A0A388KUC3_CHABU|nr:hypothetical protein CBR_g17008 [Chara braunii]|eukprot:GBG73665.1 hypothetical protein CBR_g17008 [Chara braunii]
MALLLLVEMRFGTHVIMMRQLLRLQVHLMQMVIDDRWKDTVWSTKKIRDDVAEVTACVGSSLWWEDMKAVCKLLDPIMDMLQMVDSDTRQIDKILRRQAISDDAPNDRPHPYGSWVHYWQQVEDELPTDQQLVSGRGAWTAMTQEELMQARERMRAVSRMGATRRLRMSDRRRHCSGGRGGGRRGGWRQGGRGGAGGRSSTASRRLPVDELVRKSRQRWDEGDFLYESSSSDDEDFFGTTGMPASDDDNDLGDPHPDGDNDDGAGDDDHGDGGDRPRTRATLAGGDRGLDEVADGDDRDEGDAGVTIMVTATVGEGQAQWAPHVKPHAEGSLPWTSTTTHGTMMMEMEGAPTVQDFFRADEGSAAALHPLTSAGGPEVTAMTLDTRRPPATVEQEIDRAARPPRPPSHAEHQPIDVAACAVAGGAAKDITDKAQHPVAGSSATAPRDRATVLPNLHTIPAGPVLGGWTSREPGLLAEYEARHGSAVPTKTSDVQATRAAKASLSRARKKAAERTTSRSPPHMRSHMRRYSPAHLEDGEISSESGAWGVGGRSTAVLDHIGRDGAGDGVRGEKRRGSMLIVHGDNTDVAPGETKGTNDKGDSDYVPELPKVRAADGDDGRGRRVRRRTRLGPQGPQRTPSATITAPIDRRAQAQRLLRKMEATLQETHAASFGHGQSKPERERERERATVGFRLSAGFADHR